MARIEDLLDGHLLFRRYRHPLGLPMHNKFILIDTQGSREVIFGSMNLSKNSLHANHELLVVSAYPYPKGPSPLFHLLRDPGDASSCLGGKPRHRLPPVAKHPRLFHPPTPCDAILAVVHAVRDALVADGIAVERVEVVYGSFEPGRFNPELSGEGMRRAWQVPASREMFR